eukprot:SAG31_NODE_10553_length_1125_cov_1.905458_1_plen_349_part_10
MDGRTVQFYRPGCVLNFHETSCEWRPGQRSQGGCWVLAETAGERVMFAEPFTERAHRPQSPTPDAQSGAGLVNPPDDGWRPTREPNDAWAPSTDGWRGGRRDGWGSSNAPRPAQRTDQQPPPPAYTQPVRAGRGRGRELTCPAWANGTATAAQPPRLPHRSHRSKATGLTQRIVDHVGYSTRRSAHPPEAATTSSGAASAGPLPFDERDTVDLTQEEVAADADAAPADMPATPIWIGGWTPDNWLPEPIRALVVADRRDILDGCTGVSHLHGQSCRFAQNGQTGETANDVGSGCASCERLTRHPKRTSRVLPPHPRGLLRQLAPETCLGGDTIKASLGLLAAYLKADTS